MLEAAWGGLTEPVDGVDDALKDLKEGIDNPVLQSRSASDLANEIATKRTVNH